MEFRNVDVEINDVFIPILSAPVFMLMGWNSLCLYVQTYEDPNKNMSEYISRLYPVLRYIYKPLNGDKIQTTRKQLKSTLIRYRLLLFVLILFHSWPGQEIQNGKLDTFTDVFEHVAISLILIFMYIVFFNVRPKTN